MKKLIIFLLGFFVCLSCFAQDVEKRYFENNPTLGGDVVIKSASSKVEKGEIHKTFEVEVLGGGAYYMDAWIVAPFTKEGYAEYKVAVNDILTDFSFKPQTDDWHGLALTDAKKSVTAVNLKKGKNVISIIGKGPEIPNVEFIKLSSSHTRSGISDSKYREFVDNIRTNTLANTDAILTRADSVVTQSRGTDGERYSYCLNMPVFYTTRLPFTFSTGQSVSIKTSQSGSYEHVIEFFSATNPSSYSWVTYSSGNGNLNVTIPTSGAYYLRIRAYRQYTSGLVNLTVNGTNYSNCVVSGSGISTFGGYSANPFTCKTTNNGDTWLFLEEGQGVPGRIIAYNDDAGITSDGYSWGFNSKIVISSPDVNAGLVSAHSSYIPSFTCDLYMGLALPNDTLLNLFPNLPEDNSFISAPASGNYYCYHWSVGINSVEFDWEYPYPSLTADTGRWDDFYEHYGYTNKGANADNAAIALWTGTYVSTIDGKPVNAVNHASVRKNTTIPKPHGFEWESKCGAMERVMHTRDALVGGLINETQYGTITRYYRSDPTRTVNYSPPRSPESSFSALEINQIATLRNQIPVAVLSGFEEKYHAWENTWSRPEIAIHSNPYRYAESAEYENLLKYSMKYGKAVWPLLFDKLAQKNFFIVNLLKDLTYSGKRSFGDDIMPIIEKGKPLPSAYSILVDYCKKLLTKEDVNILKSIRDISATDEGDFEVNISVNAQEMLLNLYSAKDEKASVKIYNAFGGLEFEANYILSKGNQTLTVNASNFKKGVYVVQIAMGGESISKTISL